jgi:hypothetical protein
MFAPARKNQFLHKKTPTVLQSVFKFHLAHPKSFKQKYLSITSNLMNVVIMINKNSNNIAIQGFGLFSVLFLASFLMSALHAQAQPNTDTDGINASVEKGIQTNLFHEDSKPYGLTFGEWTAKWWQWAYAIPKNTNPAYDDTGRYCTVNQKGPVWFFTGSYGKDASRQCSVPSDKDILFPILNSECSFAEFPSLKNEEQLRVCAKETQDTVTQVKASMDGKNITNLEGYRIQSPLFNLSLPENNIVGLPPQSTQAVSDGNWVFLKPLPKGEHIISFKGDLRNISDVQENKNNSFSFAGPYGWDNKVTYHTSSIVGSSNNNNSSLPSNPIT